MDAEERAREAASQGLSRRLKESEGRGEALTDSVVELREALERQRQAADLREEMLKQVQGGRGGSPRRRFLALKAGKKIGINMRQGMAWS